MKPFERITISDSTILDYPATQRILKNLGKYGLLPGGATVAELEMIEVVDADTVSKQLALRAEKSSAPNNHAVALGKRILHLTTQPGVFMKSCPGSNNMLCCQYHIVNMVSNCPFDCTYCYLQTYLNQTLTTIYVNEDDIFSQVRDLLNRRESNNVLRVGTGELSDSLALDPITEFSGRLATVMGEFENVRLELKTKSKSVEHLFGLPKKDHVIISWSMNPPEIINAEEHGTARFEERVNAAALCAKQGFRVGFHFDPMIYSPNWKEIYLPAVEKLLNTVPTERIEWMSMGALRYQPQLKSIALKRRPETTLFFDETITGEDGKMRYLRTMRTEMFSAMNDFIKTKAPSINTYLCMETMPVWEKAMGRLPDRTF